MEERRSGPRWPAATTVRLQVLGPQRIALPAQLLDYSDWGACVEVSLYVSPGTLVRLDFEDELWLGEVAHCQPRPGVYALGLRVEQRLAHLQELRTLFQGHDWWHSQSIEKPTLTRSVTR